jgi:D-ribose pyranose/furanose isomerase RbsD
LNVSKFIAMTHVTNHPQFIQLLKKFDENLILTDEMVLISYEFLFEGRKYLPFNGLPELCDILNYLKDNMAVNNLSSIEGLLNHYDCKIEQLTEFLDELSHPKFSCVHVFFGGGEIHNTEFHNFIKTSPQIPMIFRSCNFNELSIITSAQHQSEKESIQKLLQTIQGLGIHNQEAQSCSDESEEFVCCS